MRILLDENLNWRLERFLPGHEVRAKPLECGNSSPLWIVAEPLSFGRRHAPKEKAAPPQRKAVMNHRTPKKASHRQWQHRESVAGKELNSLLSSLASSGENR